MVPAEIVTGRIQILCVPEWPRAAETWPALGLCCKGLKPRLARVPRSSGKCSRVDLRQTKRGPNRCCGTAAPRRHGGEGGPAVGSVMAVATELSLARSLREEARLPKIETEARSELAVRRVPVEMPRKHGPVAELEQGRLRAGQQKSCRGC